MSNKVPVSCLFTEVHKMFLTVFLNISFHRENILFIRLQFSLVRLVSCRRIVTHLHSLQILKEYEFKKNLQTLFLNQMVSKNLVLQNDATLQIIIFYLRLHFFFFKFSGAKYFLYSLWNINLQKASQKLFLQFLQMHIFQSWLVTKLCRHKIF